MELVIQGITPSTHQSLLWVLGRRLLLHQPWPSGSWVWDPKIKSVCSMTKHWKHSHQELPWLRIKIIYITTVSCLALYIAWKASLQRDGIATHGNSTALKKINIIFKAMNMIINKPLLTIFFFFVWNKLFRYCPTQIPHVAKFPPCSHGANHD